MDFITTALTGQAKIIWLITYFACLDPLYWLNFLKMNLFALNFPTLVNQQAKCVSIVLLLAFVYKL